jgi:hypothetical protein
VECTHQHGGILRFGDESRNRGATSLRLKEFIRAGTELTFDLQFPLDMVATLSRETRMFLREDLSL